MGGALFRRAFVFFTTVLSRRSVGLIQRNSHALSAKCIGRQANDTNLASLVSSVALFFLSSYCRCQQCAESVQKFFLLGCRLCRGLVITVECSSPAETTMDILSWEP